MELEYKKLEGEKDITKRMSAEVDTSGGGIVIYLKDDDLSRHIGFFTPEKFYPMMGTEEIYRLVFIYKSISPNANTWFKVFRREQ